MHWLILRWQEIFKIPNNVYICVRCNSYQQFFSRHLTWLLLHSRALPLPGTSPWAFSTGPLASSSSPVGMTPAEWVQTEGGKKAQWGKTSLGVAAKGILVTLFCLQYNSKKAKQRLGKLSNGKHLMKGWEYSVRADGKLLFAFFDSLKTIC